ncbi:hypothetical protein RHGRI_020187 [Rhododendron griersonianum]|uniref:Uncharacterized protein n=1 Tax=Rhododendron griersonianum TaxID=479676 RepID=A0AAV6JFC1_9ERIC|nr:hypothetical protein RHGRI_020187 [Rhododendron griersonianum]
MDFDAQPLALVAEEETTALVPVHPPLMFSLNERIRPLLDAVDKLRHLKVAQEGIQLPTIVVVGDQSAGKSSVLESLAGISLPRGQGICTRVPLIMRLQHHPHARAPFGGISNTPLTLVVKKRGVPDLTMVDLPGITRVPVHGQPEDIYEQISGIIMEYIKPEESIILKVLSATVDFPTCESIRMSQRVDKTGERTLAVVTKADKAPEVNIGLGYVCVRNRIGDESYEEARVEETGLFQTHPLLSKIDESMVGVPVLAQKLVQIQPTIISRCLPDIVRKINEKLNASISELNKMPQNLSSVAEAMTAFMRIIGLSKESLKKILLRGEFDEYPDEKHMHCTARLVEMLNQYSDELQKSAEDKSTDNFLLEEIRVLNETKGIGLPNFLPRTAFLMILQEKVKEISKTPVDFIAKVWDYILQVVISVFTNHCDSYPQLQASTIRAARFGEIEVGHLRDYPSVREQAFYMKMRITAYWKVVLKRFVDSMALHLLLSVQNLVNRDMEIEVVNEFMGPHDGGIERILEESPAVAKKRERLNKSIKLLKDSKDVVAEIMDRITVED